jgi:isopentenyl-diphosphate Delta-isomerase
MTVREPHASSLDAEIANEIAARKLKHIEVCLEYPVEYTTKTTGLEHVPWPYDALPELSLADVSLETEFLGKHLRAPIIIGAMTGGAERAAKINRNLAIAAHHLGLGLMLGSQRVMIEREEARSSFQVREFAPDILLIGNIGVAQLRKGYGSREACMAIELVGADALAFHTNPLQEALQENGDTDFSDLIPTLERVVPDVAYPVMLKEVGHGLSGALARAVNNVGFAALDVGGAGGTSWAKVEDFVNHGILRHPDLCEIGIPTAQALRECHSSLPAMPLMASGGIRTGLDIAKSLSLGANVAALAKPLLAPALESPEAVIAHLEKLIFELRVSLFAAGLRSIEQARAINR